MLEYKRDSLWEIAGAKSHGCDEGPSVVASRGWSRVERFKMGQEFWRYDISHNSRQLQKCMCVVVRTKFSRGNDGPL